LHYIISDVESFAITSICTKIGKSIGTDRTDRIIHVAWSVANIQVLSEQPNCHQKNQPTCKKDSIALMLIKNQTEKTALQKIDSLTSKNHTRFTSSASQSLM